MTGPAHRVPRFLATAFGGSDSELIQLAERCLAPDKADRPADGGEVAAAVASYLSSVQERLQQERLARERQEVRAAEGRRRQRVLAKAGLIIVLTLSAVARRLEKRLEARGA